MRRDSKGQGSRRLLTGVLAVGLALMLALSVDGLGLVSRADSQAKVIVSSAKIRSEASTDSTAIGGATKDTIVSVISEVQGADGKVWYQIWVDANTKGYIRSDLVEMVEGNAPPATATPTVTNPPETPAVVTEVNPVSATVEGGTSVRVRVNASTTSDILATVSNGLALTVTGQANGTDGKVWYQVNFISNDVQINGFIRSDFVKLSGDLTPATQEPPADVTEAPPVETEPPVATEAPVVKEYDTVLAKDGWMLYASSDPNNGWVIQDLLNGGDAAKTVKTQKVVIIVLVILMVGVIAGASYLVFKFKDMADSAYFNQVERETLQKRSAAASQGGNQRVTRTVGPEKPVSRPAGAQGQRPAGVQGQRPAGTAQGQRPAGAQGQRPAGTAQGQRPAGAQGQRPAGTAQGQRPAGGQGQQRPVSQGQNPTGSAPAPRVAETSQTAKPQPKDGQQAQGWKSKNFMSDEDDEFEFEFLNVDHNDGDK